MAKHETLALNLILQTFQLGHQFIAENIGLHLSPRLGQLSTMALSNTRGPASLQGV